VTVDGGGGNNTSENDGVQQLGKSPTVGIRLAVCMVLFRQLVHTSMGFVSSRSFSSEDADAKHLGSASVCRSLMKAGSTAAYLRPRGDSSESPPRC
jgi:hypothetical protein